MIEKDVMVKLVTAYREILAQHELFATGTTGKRIEEATQLLSTATNQGRWEETSKLAP